MMGCEAPPCWATNRATIMAHPASKSFGPLSLWAFSKALKSMGAMIIETQDHHPHVQPLPFWI